jgi:hypothetical protein
MKKIRTLGELVKDSKEGYFQGKLRCLEAPQGATERNPSLHGVREDSYRLKGTLVP